MHTTTITEFTGTNLQHMETESHDYLVRLSKETTSTTWGIQVASVNTNRLGCWLQSTQQEMQTLKGLINWQHKLLDYNSHYCAFLLGQIDEDDFEGIAESFSYETKDVRPELLTPIMEQIYRLTEIEYTPSDLAGFFECKTENVVQALKPLAISNKKLSGMLPIAKQ